METEIKKVKFINLTEYLYNNECDSSERCSQVFTREDDFISHKILKVLDEERIIRLSNFEGAWRFKDCSKTRNFLSKYFILDGLKPL